MKHGLACATMLLSAQLAEAQSADHDAFVEANIIGVFYHELGHAVIDIEAVPIFGQEEDAADVFSIYLIHSFFEDAPARSLAYDTARGFLAETEFRRHSGDEVAWWGVHGANAQRFYNSVCIFYGGAPETRADFAKSLGLPESRGEYCPEEFTQADRSWGAVLQRLVDRGSGASLRFDGGPVTLAAEVLAYEVEQINAVLQLDAPLDVTVEDCGVANAFYDPNDRRIIFCTEFETYFREMARWLL